MLLIGGVSYVFFSFYILSCCKLPTLIGQFVYLASLFIDLNYPTDNACIFLSLSRSLSLSLSLLSPDSFFVYAWNQGWFVLYAIWQRGQNGFIPAVGCCQRMQKLGFPLLPIHTEIEPVEILYLERVRI